MGASMARRVQDATLDSRDARRKLKVRDAPYWRALGRELHIGYRKGKTGGRWVMRRYAGAGKYSVETIADADDSLDADADSVLDFWQAQEAVRKHAAAPAVLPYTLQDAVDDYVAALDDKGKASAYDVRLRLAACVTGPFADIALGKLASDDVAAWHVALSKAPARVRTRDGADKPNTRPLDRSNPEAVRRRRVSANRVLASLKAALNFARRRRKVATDDAWREVEPFEGVNAARERHLSVAEAQRLVNAAAPDDFRRLVQAALQTGARYGELARLCVRDYDGGNGSLAVHQSKSGKPRHITLTEEAQEFFRQITTGRAPGEIMLLRGDREWRRSEQTEPMAEACARAKLEPIGFHGLRHTWASLAVMGGVPLIIVARNLGHSDTRMVEKHYGHLAGGYVVEAIRAGAPRFGTVDRSNVKAIR